MNIINRPKCSKPDCDNYALTIINNKWCCGECYKKMIDKLNKLKEDIWLQE